MTTLTETKINPLTAGQLPNLATWATLACALAVGAVIDSTALDGFDPGTTVFLGAVIYLPAIYLLSRGVEGRRRATDRLATNLVAGAFLLALLPLVSLLWESLAGGLPRFDASFFSWSMRNVIGDGGGAVHAIYGTLFVTGIATLISVPIGLMTAVYLVEYGRGSLARGITFFVDVMTGIPSIVAGLFAYALMAIVFGPGTIHGFSGSLALSVLMIPIVVRATEELLRIVPNELREASYALGVPKWRTIMSVVLPTSLSGIISGVILAIARIVGETAPLMIAAGFTNSINTNPFANPMMTLPVFVYDQYAHPGIERIFYNERAWAGALTLIVLVMVLNLIGRFIAKRFAPSTGR
jgi:phosphate transport system permease protein